MKTYLMAIFINLYFQYSFGGLDATSGGYHFSKLLEYSRMDSSTEKKPGNNIYMFMLKIHLVAVFEAALGLWRPPIQEMFPIYENT